MDPIVEPVVPVFDFLSTPIAALSLSEVCLLLIFCILFVRTVLPLFCKGWGIAEW